MRRAPEPIHDRDAETFLRQRFGHDAIECGVIEFAQLAKKIRRRFAQIAGRAEPARLDERSARTAHHSKARRRSASHSAP